MTGRLSQHPLLAPLLVGLILRLVAAQFSTGYLMHDDHFMVVEVAASWADGEDYNNWLPWNQSGTPKAHPANFAYASTQFLVFKLLQGVGIEHPGNQAFIIRVLHGLYSCFDHLAWLLFGQVSSSTPTQSSPFGGLDVGRGRLLATAQCPPTC